MRCGGCSACARHFECGGGVASTVERVAKWGGSSLSLFGSLLLATTRSAGTSPLAFLLLLIASTAWAVAGVAMRDRAVVASSLIGMAFNLSATLIRL